MEPNTDFLQNIVRSHLAESARVKRRLAGAGGGFDNSGVQAVTAGLSMPRYSAEDKEDGTDGAVIDTIVRAASTIAAAFKNGGKLLLCGNGGSAADCQHMAAEFVSILSKDFKRPGLPAIALTTDTSFLTAYGNDFENFGGVFERQVQALGKKGDVLLAVSTSGASPNILRAVSIASQKEMPTIGLCGQGGKLREMADIIIVVPSKKTSHIQEAHLAIEHAICEVVEHLMFPEKGSALMEAV